MAVLAHQPPETIRLKENEPLIFLAGPIQGAPDWQTEATSILARHKLKARTGEVLHIANPRKDYLDGDFNYEEQVAWEKEGLQRARKHGAIIFWFAAQDPSQEYEAGRAYAQTSRIEFGRILGWLDNDPSINLVLGIEDGYSGSERYFKTCAKEKRLRVHQSLNDVCERALRDISK